MGEGIMRKHRWPAIRLLLPTLALVALGTVRAGSMPTRTQVESGTQVDAKGRVIRTEHGQRFNYQREAPGLPVKRRQSVGAATASVIRVAATDPIGLPSHAAFASFASLGPCLGCTGLIYRGSGRGAQVLGSTTAVNMSAPGNTWAPDDFWYALSYDSPSASFRQVFISDRQPGGISSMQMLPPRQGMAGRIAICGFDGSVRFYASDTKVFLPAETLQFPVSDAAGCFIGDFDHTGQDQYLWVSRGAITIFDKAGVGLWTLPPPDYFYQGVEVGQLDEDPALEIAVSQYTAPWLQTGPPVAIYDGATHELQQQISADILPAAYGMLAANLGPGRAPTLLVSEGWYAVDAFDPGTGNRLWQAPTPINIGALAVGHVIGTGSQVLIGDRQWGAVHVVDGVTGAPLFSIKNPEYGVDALTVGRLGDDNGSKIVWTAGSGGTGPKRFLIADPVTQQVLAKSLDLDPVFTTPVLGHLSSGTARQVVFASKTTNDTYDIGAIVAMDARSGEVVAMQNDSAAQGYGNYYAVRTADLDGDGVDEVLAAGSRYYNGSIDVYEMTSDRTFVQRSTTSGASGPYPEFTALAVGRSGARSYAAAGFDEYDPSSGSLRGVVVALDPTSGAELWKVVLPGDPGNSGIYSPPPCAIEPFGRDARGFELFAVLRPAPGFPMDFPQIEQVDVIRVGKKGASVAASYSGPFISMDVDLAGSSPRRIVVGSSDGTVSTLDFDGKSLHRLSVRQVASTPIDAVRSGRGAQLWIVSGHRTGHVGASGSIDWQSTDNGYSEPSGLLVDRSTPGTTSVWTSSVWRVDGFSIRRTKGQ